MKISPYRVGASIHKTDPATSFRRPKSPQLLCHLRSLEKLAQIAVAAGYPEKIQPHYRLVRRKSSAALFLSIADSRRRKSGRDRSPVFADNWEREAAYAR